MEEGERMSEKIMNQEKITEESSPPVYVVAAYDTEKERIADINVLTNLERAKAVYGDLGMIYGKANVCFASRIVDLVNFGVPIALQDLKYDSSDPTHGLGVNARLKIGYFADGLRSLLDAHLNAFAAQLLAESYGDKRERYPHGAVCMRVPDHKGRDVFITVGTEMPDKDPV